jgi:Fe-Mn family superoxide dismutase
MEPFISARTLSFHHEKHHNAYVTNLNQLIDGTDLSSMSLENIILESSKDPNKIGIFNNAAQVWNHSFLWNSMINGGGGEPSGLLHEQIIKDFGDFANFAETFKKIGISQFGSGWVWLTWDGIKLKVRKTHDADLPLLHNEIALLTADLWEHAYYLDYQNRRADYLTIFIEKLANWNFAQMNFSQAKK